MDYILIVILIILLALFVIGLFMLLDCLGDPAFNIARRASAAIGVDGCQIYSKFSPGEDIENAYPQNVTIKNKNTPFPSTINCNGIVGSNNSGCRDSTNAGSGAVALLISTLHRGGQSYHAQGVCNVLGGSWSNTIPTVWASGRPPAANTWSPVSGGTFDTCQCEDSGGLF